MNSARSPWARAYTFLKPLEAQFGQESGFKFLFGIASRKHAKRKPPTFAPKIAIPKKADPTAIKKALHADCKALCKAIVQDRDYPTGQGKCISCGIWAALQWGHLFPQRTCKYFQYSIIATNGQCRQCNGPGGGNLEGYLKGVEAKYGHGTAAQLLRDRDRYKGFSPKIRDLEQTKILLSMTCRSTGIDPLRVLGEK